MKGSVSGTDEGEGAPRRLSVLHLCAPAEVGGLERVVQGLSSGLAERGHEVVVVAVVEPGADTAPFFGPIQEVGGRTVRLEIPGRGYLRERREVGALLDELRPHVLHTHGYRSDLLHGGSARRRGVATVSTLHGSSRMGGLSHLFEALQERALRRFDGVVAVSAPLVEVLKRKGVPSERIHLVPNGWTPPRSPLSRSEARAVLGLPPGDVPVIGWIGRLIPIKGCDVFLRALAEVGEEPWLASLIGDGPEREHLEELVTRLELGSRVRLHGAIHEAARFMAAFDLFVLSSRSEGTPMVVLEAFGSGTPVVATAVGGVPDLLEEGKAGWLAPPEDPGRLGAAIREALTGKELGLKKGERGRARIEADLGMEAWIQGHLDVYRSAMALRHRRDGRSP